MSDLVPLTNVVSIGGLHLWSMTITDLSGLEGLTSLGDLQLSGNLLLADLAVLEGVPMASVWVEGNPSLASLHGLEGAIGSEWGAVMVRDNDSLTSLDGLQGIGQAGSLYIMENAVLTDISAPPQRPPPSAPAVRRDRAAQRDRESRTAQVDSAVYRPRRPGRHPPGSATKPEASRTARSASPAIRRPSRFGEQVPGD